MKRRGSRIMLLLRMLGVIGLFAALFGGVMLSASSFDFQGNWERFRDDPKVLRDKLMNYSEDRLDQVALWSLLAGGVLAVIGLLAQLVAGLRVFAGRRNVAGVNAALQTALTLALLVLVNWWSFEHHRRIDCTGKELAWHTWRPGLKPSDRFPTQFTLPESVAADLRQLRGETTVVVYQRHKTFGQLSDKPDAYDYAAERKVVEKVQDLVREFREFGPQFRVVILDVEEEGYDKKLKELTDGDADKKSTANPDLKKAIDSAPDNSIFFHSRREVKQADGSTAGREFVQRLSFNDFYQLDKSASLEANHKRGNLVLLPQGVEPFARRVLAIEEKRPKVGIAVIHQVLTTEGADEIGLAGLRKALAAQGFASVDIVLKKKWGEAPEPEPAAFMLGESKLEQIDEYLADNDFTLSVLKAESDRFRRSVDTWKSKSIAELKQLLRDQVPARMITEEFRKAQVDGLTDKINEIQAYQNAIQQDQRALETERSNLTAAEGFREDQRITDVQAKFTKLLSDCDLLIVPRMTLLNIPSGSVIHPKYHRIDSAQVDAIRQFVKAGKPVLACFGPGNEPPERRMPPTAAGGPEPLEGLFAQLGIIFGNQTILYDAEQKAFSERRTSALGGLGDVKIPPVLFDAPARVSGEGEIASIQQITQPKNPLSEAMEVVARSTGQPDKLKDLSVRHPRPMYFVPVRGGTTFAAGFLFSDRASWNEDQPFPSRDKPVRYEPSKAGDAKRGTRDEERRGPFVVGVAVETTVPAEWMKPELAAVKAAALVGDAAETNLLSYALATEGLVPTDLYAPAALSGYKPMPVRVAAVGHGGVFSGPDLAPAKEKLLLNTCNWLLSREDRLPRADRPAWQFPRVSMGERRTRMWEYGTLFGIPGAFALCGCVVLLVRRYR